MTVRDIATAAGVSIATVSRVMNGQAGVSTETREAVEGAMARLGTPQARARVAGRSGRDVLVRCPYVLTDYFGIRVSVVAETLEPHERQVILKAGDAIRPSEVLAGLPDRTQLGGAIPILPPEPARGLKALRQRDFPFVVIDPRTPLPRDTAAVSAEQFSGARSVTAHLLSLGHRRIGMIGGPEDWPAGQSRLAGHASALAEVGVLPSPELCSSIAPTSAWGGTAPQPGCSTCPSGPPPWSRSTTGPPWARCAPRTARAGRPQARPGRAGPDLPGRRLAEKSGTDPRATPGPVR